MNKLDVKNVSSVFVLLMIVACGESVINYLFALGGW